MGLFKEHTEDQIAKDEEMLESIEKGMPFISVERYISTKERQKRGCGHCAYAEYASRKNLKGGIALKKNERVLVCMFDHCPLHILDKYNDYRDYLKEYDGKMEKIMAEALKKKVESITGDKKEKEKKEEEPPKPVDKKTRWLIGVRRSQGFTVEQMQSEFGLNRDQIIKEIKRYDKKHSYV